MSSEAGEEVHWVTCPACQKIAEKYPEGIVTLRGDYLWHHEEEIRNVLKKRRDKGQDQEPPGTDHPHGA